MKKAISLLLAAAMTVSLGATAFAAEDTDPKTDTNQTAPVYTRPVDVTGWFAEAADYVLENKLMDTVEIDGAASFQPDAFLSRQAIAESIFRDATARDVASVDGDAGMSFKELADYADIDETYLPAASFCYYTGIMAGDNEKKLHPDSMISREELAAVLTRYYKYLVKTDADLESGMAIKEFTDYADIQAWAHEELQFCVNAGLLKGNKDGSFNPKGNVTRAEMAQILFNLENTFVEKAYEGLKLISK